MRAAEPASFDAVDETIRSNHYKSFSGDSWQDAYGPTKKLHVMFLTDGVPLKTETYMKICETFGVEIGNATRCESTQMRSQWNIITKPLSFTVEPDSFYDTESRYSFYEEKDIKEARRALIPNPFHQHPNLLNSLNFERDFDREEVEAKDWMRESLTAPEKFVVNLTGRPRIDRPQLYRIDDFEAHVSTGLTVGFNHINISCNANVVEGLD